jgi:uncharacterized protein (TIGR02421 family)
MKRAERVSDLDRAVVRAASKVRVLSSITWPADLEETFLSAWRAGAPELPRPGTEPRDHGSEVAALEDLAAQCDMGDPRQAFIARTARSYATAGRLLGAIGTPAFAEHSIALYGRPDTVWKLQGWSPVDAARFFLEITDDLISADRIPPRDATISSGDFAASMRSDVERFFDADEVKVELDPELTSKAIAGSKRMRIRDGAMFSELDHDQLLQHEAYVHTATALNGRRQKALTCLRLGAPRTTQTQEGIAVFSEIATGAIDVGRLRRIAHRVVAIKNALDGADFIEVFEQFVEAGQTETEAFSSAQRVFRGGDVRGGVPFTKDAVYLTGVLEVHAFLRIAIRDNRPELIRHLLAGRLTLADTLRLAPLFESGVLVEPAYIVPWARDIRRLAALLTYSAFMSEIKLAPVDLDRVVRFEDERERSHGPDAGKAGGDAPSATVA